MKYLIIIGSVMLASCSAKKVNVEVKPDLSNFASKQEVRQMIDLNNGATRELNERLNVVEEIVYRREEECPCK